jgi:hypothetical protein
MPTPALLPSRATLLPSLLALLSAGVFAVPGAGQEQGRFLPATIVPNYDRIRIGQVEGLEGGAFAARTNDSGANWYNPAGLALADRSGLNASATAYEYTTVNLGGLNREFGSGRFSSLGTYFAGVLGGDVLGSSRLRLGFSITRPVVWSPGAISGETVGSPEGGAERVDFYSSADMSTMLPAVNAGFRLAEGLRVGGGFAIGITKIETNQHLANRFVTPTAAQRESRSLNFDGQYFQMQFTAGVQWDLSERIRLGGTLSTPGIGIGGSALMISQASAGGPSGTQEFVFRDDEASFAYELPSRAVAGVAVNLGRFEVEADVRYYGSREAYELLSSDVPSTFLTTDASGTPEVEQILLQPAVEEADAVTNLALGVNYPLSDSWRLHGGVFTDGSPVGDSQDSVFGKVDLTGFSFAISFGGRLSGTVGVSSSWGTTEEGTVGPTLGGVERQTTVDIRSVNLHYALSYTFN